VFVVKTIKKYGDERYPSIEIHDGVKSFKIGRAEFPDPVWFPEVNAYKNNHDIVFTFTQADKELYELFLKLYKDIISGNVFPLQYNDIIDKTHDEIIRLKRKKDKERFEYKKRAENIGLVKDGVIQWHSEDYDPYEYSSILKIEKVDNQIIVTFIKNKEHQEHSYYMPTYLVRITESGGIYASTHYFVHFVRLHRALQALDWPEPDLADNPNLTLRK